MSHNVVPPLKGPAPPADEVMTLWKRLKRLGTQLSTEEVFQNGRDQRAGDEGPSIDKDVGVEVSLESDSLGARLFLLQRIGVRGMA